MVYCSVFRLPHKYLTFPYQPELLQGPENIVKKNPNLPLTSRYWLGCIISKIDITILKMAFVTMCYYKEKKHCYSHKHIIFKNIEGAFLLKISWKLNNFFKKAKENQSQDVLHVVHFI